MGIPRRLIRTVPEHTTDEVEKFWADAMALHPGWEFVTLRDPVDRGLFPSTGHLFDQCESGAQLADLIRIEYLYRYGGIYLDSDVEVYKSFEPLIGLPAFAGYDCVDYIPNAVMGAQRGHLAMQLAMTMALENFPKGTWQTGVGATTAAFNGPHSNMALFPPGSFYPIFWKDRDRTDWSTVRQRNPWAYCAHHANFSWKVAAR